MMNVKSRADVAVSAAQSAALTAQHAQATADSASALMTKTNIDALNEKIDRMLKRSVSK